MTQNGNQGPSQGTVARPRLLESLRAAIGTRHYSRRTGQAYLYWIRRFIVFSGKRHPRELGAPEVTAFLSHLAVEGGVAAATQNQALAALLFLYKEVMGEPLPWLDDIVRAKRPVRKPTVLTSDEVRGLLANLRGPKWLMASLLYGAGLRLRECLTLRVKDIDFGYGQILVRDGKGGKQLRAAWLLCKPKKLGQAMEKKLGHREFGKLRKEAVARQDLSTAAYLSWRGRLSPA